MFVELLSYLLFSHQAGTYLVDGHCCCVWQDYKRDCLSLNHVPWFDFRRWLCTLLVSVSRILLGEFARRICKLFQIMGVTIIIIIIILTVYPHDKNLGTDKVFTISLKVNRNRPLPFSYIVL